MSCVAERYICITNCDVIPFIISNAGVMFVAETAEAWFQSVLASVCCSTSYTLVLVFLW